MLTQLWLHFLLESSHTALQLLFSLHVLDSEKQRIPSLQCGLTRAVHNVLVCRENLPILPQNHYGEKLLVCPWWPCDAFVPTNFVLTKASHCHPKQTDIFEILQIINLEADKQTWTWKGLFVSPLPSNCYHISLVGLLYAISFVNSVNTTSM